MARYPRAGFAMLGLFLLSEIAQLCLCGNSSVGCIERERQALLKFKATLADPSHMLSSWNANDCCLWNGIGCHNLTGHIIKLDLSSNHLEAGGVDSSLMQLEHLSYLDLRENNFGATPIPFFFASMKQLRYLSISGANFSGKLPYNLGNLTNLYFLDLSSNDLYTNDMNWASDLRSLQYLNMSGVDLEKAHNLFQVIYMLPSLLQLHLADCGLHNLIPPRLPLKYNFTYIPRVQVLDLADNEIDGPILDVFQHMTSVEVLELSGNNLSSVPLWLGMFNNLMELHIGHNSGLQGSLPLALQNLTSIRVLDLKYDKFNSIPSWLGEFKNLVLLDLSGNALHGSVPEVFRNLTSLEDLSLSVNHLRSIPSWLGELKNLRHIDVALNGLTTMESSLSSILRNMCHLRSLDFSENNLRGEAFGDSNLSECIRYDLQELILTDNKLNDSLPTWLRYLENLKNIDLRDNLLFGPIPFSIGKLSQLTSLLLGNNRLNGSIPYSIGKLVNLNDLDLSNNKLDGVLPDSLGLLVNLASVDLSRNSFYGNIPQSLGQLVHLSSLHLHRNNLHGSIPDSFSKLVNLASLDLSFNHLEGTFFKRKGWSSFMELEYLSLSNNQISGSLPKNISDIMPKMESLNLGNNLISGSIPSSLCEIKTLYSLDLSKNKISGEIPDCWGDNLSDGLDEINLSFNKLSGVFPMSFNNLSSLLWLHLNNNYLKGELPLSMKNLKQLKILNLGENQFSGSIPSWTSNTFPSLQILRLHQNMLNGSIPSHLCQLTSLQILDLASNNLTGSIPHCIGSLEGMTKYRSLAEADKWKSYYQYLGNLSLPDRILLLEWPEEDVEQVMKGVKFDYTKILQFVINIDLSNNNLIGLIPEGIAQLTGLHGLNLSNNHLEGEIPQMVGNMTSLESLDISRNRLSGTIPNSITSLTSLSYLNMSYNNFSGPIPRENQFLTLDDPYIYSGNPYLCGVPLPNKCPGDDSHQVPVSKELPKDENDSEKFWFRFVIAAGFAIGFWAVIGTLVLKKSWRYACFQRVDDTVDKVYVTIIIKVARLKRMMRNFVNG